MTSTVATLALPAAGLAGLGAALTARRWPFLVPMLLVATGMYLVVASTTDGRDLPRSGPLGYANASAAVCVAAGAAALHVHLMAPSLRLRRVMFVLMLVLLAMPLWFRSRAAGAGAAVVLAGLAPVVQRLGARAVAALGAAVVAVTAAGTVALALLWRQGPGTPGRRVSERLVGVRAELWQAALEQWRADPWLGGGRFVAGEADALDFRRFAHSAFLHAGAVHGGVGVGLLVLLGALVVIVLGRVDTVAAVVAALAATALGLQAGVDYVGHFTVVLVAFAALVGGALTSPEPTPRSRQP